MQVRKQLSFDEFRATLADLLGLDAAEFRPEARFVDDLGVDSLRMVEVMLRLAQRGIELPPEVAWQVQTVGDAYKYYREQVGGQA